MSKKSSDNWSHEDVEKSLNGSSSSKPKSGGEQPDKENGTSNKTGYTIIAILALGLSLIIGFYWNQSQHADRVTVSGTFYTNESAVLEASAIPDTISLDSLDFMAMINRIETLPYVKEAHIEPNPPNELMIKIVEREPLALLVKNQKRSYVDTDGIQLPVILERTPDVPILYGFSVSLNDTLHSDEFKKVQAFLTELHTHSLSNITLSELAWTPTQGLVAMSRENGVKIIFGEEHPAQSLSNWELFYRQIVPKVGINNLTEVDLRYKNQVITRPS